MANVSELVILLRAVNMASRELNALDRQIGRVQAAQQKNAQGAAAASALMTRGIIGVAAAAIGTTAVITKMGFEYNSVKESATTAFTGILRDSRRASQFIEELYDWTRQTSLGFDFAARSAQEFLARGFDIERVIPTMEAIANAAAALPRPMEESMQRISYAIGQISQSAKLHSQDIRQLTEAGINAWGYLQEATGASIDEMQEDALEFGLTGKRVADIILQGIARDFPNQLALQRQTMRGATAEFSRNASEIAGIFSKPFFDKFLEGLHNINRALNDPETRAAAERYGNFLASMFELPISMAEKFLARLEDIRKLPTQFAAKVGIENKETVEEREKYGDILWPFKETARILGLTGGSLETQLGRLGVEMQRLTEMRDAAGTPENLREQLNLNRINEDITATQAKIDALQNEINALGNASAGTAVDVSSLGARLNAAQSQLDAFTVRAESTRQAASDLFSKPTRELLQAQYEALQYQASMAAEVNRLEAGLSSLDREARNAARANALAVQAIDDNIRSIERGIAARDRAEQRAEMIEDAKITASQQALAALEQQERALQKQELARRSREAKTPEERQSAQLALQRFDIEDRIRQEEAKAEAARRKLELERFDRATREMEQMQILQDQRDELIRTGQATQEAYDAQKENIQAQLDLISQGAEQRQSEVEKLQITNELLQREIELMDPFLLTQDELKTKAEDLKDEFAALIEPVAEVRKVLAAIAQEQVEARLVEMSNIAAGEAQAYGGARASGGRVYPNKWYMVGEHGPEPFIPDSAGTVLPSGSNTTNNRKTVVLAPINVYTGGNGSNEDALDFLFKKM